MSEPDTSQTSSSRAPRRKVGVLLHESPVLEIEPFKELNLQQCTSFPNEAPTHRATFSGSSSVEASLKASAKKACGLHGFRAGSGTRIIITSPTNDEHEISSATGSYWSLLEDHFNPHHCSQASCRPASKFSSLSSRIAIVFDTGSQLSARTFENNDIFQSTVDITERDMPASESVLGSNGQLGTNSSSNAANDRSKLALNNQQLSLAVNKKLASFGAKNLASGDDASISTGTSRRVQRYQNDEAPFPMAGIAGTLMASFFFSTGLLFVKLIPDGDSLEERLKQVCFRGVVITILTSITIIVQKSTFAIKRDEIFITLLRSLISFGAITLSYVALKYISVGESQAIIFSSPMWTSIFSYFILGENFSLFIVLAFPVSAFGILLIAHPDLIIDVRETLVEEIHYHHHENQYPHHLHGAHSNYSGEIMPNWTNSLNRSMLSSSPINLTTTLLNTLNSSTITEEDEELVESYFETRWPGIVISVFSSILFSLVYIVLKFRKSTPIQTTTFYLGVTTIVLSAVLSCIVGFGRWPDTNKEWLLILSSGVFSWLGQSVLQWATAYENASVLSVVRATDVVMSFIYSVAFLDEDILWTSAVGASLILGVVAAMVLNNYVSSLCCGNKLTK